MISVVPLSIGVTFKRVFSQPKVFKPFVKDVLGIDVNGIVPKNLSRPHNANCVKRRALRFRPKTLNF